MGRRWDYWPSPALLGELEESPCRVAAAQSTIIYMQARRRPSRSSGEGGLLRAAKYLWVFQRDTRQGCGLFESRLPTERTNMTGVRKSVSGYTCRGKGARGNGEGSVGVKMRKGVGGWG